MASVDGLLERHELAARRRVDGLREEADHIQAEQEWQEWAIARRRVATVLAPDDGNIADRRNHTAVDGLNPQHRRGWHIKRSSRRVRCRTAASHAPPGNR
ncbi:hypothetical protein ACIRVK_41565 [Streptomyces sp. NPDC101152]|uniref:hypothetical protein n=1 Tax=Streptomyces sp. NPDC101152 TaxID=3366116 RepID=UPI0038020384